MGVNGEWICVSCVQPLTSVDKSVWYWLYRQQRLINEATLSVWIVFTNKNTYGIKSTVRNILKINYMILYYFMPQIGSMIKLTSSQLKQKMFTTYIYLL